MAPAPPRGAPAAAGLRPGLRCPPGQARGPTAGTARPGTSRPKATSTPSGLCARRTPRSMMSAARGETSGLPRPPPVTAHGHHSTRHNRRPSRGPGLGSWVTAARGRGSQGIPGTGRARGQLPNRAPREAPPGATAPGRAVSPLSLWSGASEEGVGGSQRARG